MVPDCFKFIMKEIYTKLFFECFVFACERAEWYVNYERCEVIMFHIKHIEYFAVLAGIRDFVIANKKASVVYAVCNTCDIKIKNSIGFKSDGISLITYVGTVVLIKISNIFI